MLWIYLRPKVGITKVQELYEPLWIDLYARSKAEGLRIRGIWIADVAHQGASLALNEPICGLDREYLFKSSK